MGEQCSGTPLPALPLERHKHCPAVSQLPKGRRCAAYLEMSQEMLSLMFLMRSYCISLGGGGGNM